MRDSFDHYFTGWNLDPEAPADAQAAFAVLVGAVRTFVTDSAPAAEAWRVFPLDGKKECFFHFAKMARDAGALPVEVKPILDQLKAAYPRSFA